MSTARLTSKVMEKILRSVARMDRFIELQAPEHVIETEAIILAKRALELVTMLHQIEPYPKTRSTKRNEVTNV